MTAPSHPRHSTADFDPLTGPRADLARAIPRRPRVKWWGVIALGVAFAVLVVPTITVDRWFGVHIEHGKRAPITVRVPPFAGYQTQHGHIDGGVLIARGETATRDDELNAADVAEAMPHGPAPYAWLFLVTAVLGSVYSHHLRRSNRGRLIRVQAVSLGAIAIAAAAVKLVLLATAVSVLVVPVAVFAMVPTIVLDRVVGLATGTVAALVVAMVGPFDVGVAIVLLVQVGVAGLVVAERPKGRWRAALLGGAVATLLTGLTYPLMVYLTTGHFPFAELRDPLHSAWLAAALGPAIATAIAVPAIPIYELLVGEITAGKLIQLEDLSNPLLRQISERSPGTWQHSLTMANMAEIAANAIGANGRLVRVGAYYHDLGKSLEPKYFIENLEPGETSPHDQLPPEASCDAIFAHVTEGIVTARKAGLHERIIDFMHMHHGNGVLEYFWAKCRDQGNPKKLSIDHFRYPGVPPQSRETAILAICDAVEAASRTLKKPEPAAIDNLVQRIIYGKLHLGQLDESGLSMADLRKMADSLKDTIRHANHGRIEYPWQKAAQDASASVSHEPLTATGPRLDSLDRPARPDSVRAPAVRDSDDALAVTADQKGETPNLKRPDLAMDATAPAPLVTPTVDNAGQRDRRTLPGNDPAARAVSPARREVQAEVARVLGDEVIPLEHSAGAVQQWRAADAGMSRPHVTMPTPAGRAKRPSRSPEIGQFTAEAQQALDEASKDRIAASARDSSEPRKRAATIPPVKPPTFPPPVGGRRAPTVPPLPGMLPPITMPGHAPGPAHAAPLARAKEPSAPIRATEHGIQRPGTGRTFNGPPPGPPPANIEAAVTNPRMPAQDDASRTEPRMHRLPTGAEPDDTQPRLELPLTAPPASDPSIALPGALPEASTSWARGLAARIDAAIDDDFGGETPVIAPTRAELQALLGTPLDATRVQSVEEVEALQARARDRRSDRQLEVTRRAPYPTAEVDDADIEAAIELAPPARRPSNAVGVAKKKPTE